MKLSIRPGAIQDGDQIDLPWGKVIFNNNELTIASMVDDPPKLRLASVTGSAGCVTGNLQDPATGRQEEIALFQFKKDERTRGREDLNYGEMTLHLKGPPRSDGDDGMIPVMLLLHDQVWLKGVNGSNPHPPTLKLPEPVGPPPPPVDDWMSPASQAVHRFQLASINAEFAPYGMPIDDNNYDAYMNGRNRNLKEVHDDMVTRLTFDPGGHEPQEK